MANVHLRKRQKSLIWQLFTENTSHFPYFIEYLWETSHLATKGDDNEARRKT